MSASRRRVMAGAAALAAVVVLSACGSKTDAARRLVDAAAKADTSGDTIKVGLLNSLSGTMAISEVTVRDSLKLAIDEINAAGGVLGKKIEPISEDGASDWPTSPRRPRSSSSEDRVAAVFGCWTSASRKAVQAGLREEQVAAVLPGAVRGPGESPYIFYTGATTNQQIVPALDYLKAQGKKKLYLVGTDYVFPRTANKIIKAYAKANGMTVLGRGLRAAGLHRVQHHRQQGEGGRRPTRSSTPSTATERGLLQGVQVGRPDRRERCRWSRCRSPRKRSSAIGIAVPGGPADGLELLPDHRRARRTPSSWRRTRPKYGAGQADQ